MGYNNYTMVLTPHILVGAAIGAKTQNLGLIVILAIISHFILDRIPHWDYSNKELETFSQNKSCKTLFNFFLKIAIDGLMGLIIVIFIIWQKNIINPKYLFYVLIGISASLLPDILLGFAKFFSNKSRVLRVYKNLHEKTLHNPKHIKKPTLLGLGTQLLTIVIAIIILLL